MKDLDFYGVVSSELANDALTVIGVDADGRELDWKYFEPLFRFSRLPADWEAPKVVYGGRGKPALDLIKWQWGLWLMSERAVEGLRALIESSVQIVFFKEIKKVPYYLINPLIQLDCVDVQRSDVREIGDPEDVYRYRSYSKRVLLIPDAIPKDVHFFHTKVDMGPVVSKAFVGAVIEKKLTGMGFRDLSVSWSSFARKDYLDPVPEVNDPTWVRK